MGLKSGAPASPGLAERLVATVGKSAAWLCLGIVSLTFIIVMLRYGFSMGWIWLQESVIYLHAAVFLLAAAWTLQEDGHVRVDIFYRRGSPTRKAWINLLGCVLFLAPFCTFLILVSWDYVAASWRLLEGSREAGGVPLVYVLKSLILLFPALLLLQCGCSMRRALNTIRAESRKAV